MFAVLQNYYEKLVLRPRHSWGSLRGQRLGLEGARGRRRGVRQEGPRVVTSGVILRLVVGAWADGVKIRPLSVHWWGVNAT